MLNIPSPILIIGDQYLSKSTIISAKKKYTCKWVILSATEKSPEEIRMESGMNDLFSEDKIILIQDIPNKKQVREFIVDLVKSSSDNLKFIIWDSNGHIKLDPKTKTYLSTWKDFVEILEKSGKLVNNGFDFSDKEDYLCVKFIQDNFNKYGKIIDNKSSTTFINIVGRNRGMIISEIKKLSICSPKNINSDFIIKNAFPTLQELILYKFGNALDSGDKNISILALEEFLASGVNENVIAEILVRKLRWQLAVCYLWRNNFGWNQITDIIMDMGKFPSNIWHNSDLSISDKKAQSGIFLDKESKVNYLKKELGMPENCFINTESNDRSEIIPMRFMAQQTVDFIRNKIVNGHSEEQFKENLLNKYIEKYINLIDLLKEVRFNDKNKKQYVYDMVLEFLDLS